MGSLETFLAHDGYRALAETIAKVPGILSEGDSTFILYCVAVGGCKYLRHYMGIRKRGANCTVVANTAAGANDGFLKVETQAKYRK